MYNIEIKENVYHGQPVLKGTHITVAQMLAELGDNTCKLCKGF